MVPQPEFESFWSDVGQLWTLVIWNRSFKEYIQIERIIVWYSTRRDSVARNPGDIAENQSNVLDLDINMTFPC